jgi:hypothetical protein
MFTGPEHCRNYSETNTERKTETNYLLVLWVTRQQPTEMPKWSAISYKEQLVRKELTI